MTDKDRRRSGRDDDLSAEELQRLIDNLLDHDDGDDDTPGDDNYPTRRRRQRPGPQPVEPEVIRRRGTRVRR